MPYDDRLRIRLRRQFAGRDEIVEKKMFGGLAYMLQGNLLVGVWDHALFARVGVADYDAALAEEHVRPFDVTGKPMKGWVLVDADGIATESALLAWLERAERFVATLPPK